MDYEKDFTDVFANTANGKVHYKHHKGSKYPIFFLHGLAGNIKTWTRLVGHLPDYLDVYLVDLIGHGLSDAPNIRYTLGVQIDAVKEILKKEKIDSPYFFGHSYGGWISATYALHNKTSGIVLEDSSGLRDFYNTVQGKEARIQHKEDLLEKAMMLDAKKHVITSVLDDEFVEGQFTKEDLERITVPSMVLWGENDRVIFTKYASIFAEGLKNSTLHIIKSAKHTPHYTHSELVSKLLLDWLGAVA